jgi:LysM repeat protein
MSTTISTSSRTSTSASRNSLTTAHRSLPRQRTAAGEAKIRTARPDGSRPATERPAPRSAPAPQGRVRLTRRGRIVVTLFLLALVLGAAVLLGGTSVATGEGGAEVPTRTIVVGEGDTLWEIAGEVAGPGDVREMVHQIEKLNSLPGPALEVGQEIAVPVG